MFLLKNRHVRWWVTLLAASLALLAAPALLFAADQAKAEPPAVVTAVFPPGNATGDVSLEWVGYGVQDAVITDLSYLSGFDAHAPETSPPTVAPPATCSPAVFQARVNGNAPDLAIIGSYSGSAEKLKIRLSLCGKDKAAPLLVQEVEGAPEALLQRLSERLLSVAQDLGRAARAEESLRVLAPKTRDAAAWRFNANGYLLQRRFEASDGQAGDELISRWQDSLVAAVERDPGYAEAWNNLGWCRLATGKGSSRDAFEKALALKPDVIDAHLGLAVREALLLQEEPRGSQAERETAAALRHLARAIMLNERRTLHKATERLLFDLFAAQYRVKYDRLMATRGVSSDREVGASLQRVEQAMSNYPRGTVLLFFDHSDGLLNSWAVVDGEIAAAQHVKISAEEVADLVARFRDSIVSVEQVARRGARQRGSVVRLGRKAEPPGSSGANDALTRLLFPPQVIHAMEAADHLLIVPTLSIGTVPFAALKPYTGSDAPSYLVDEMSITVAPSLGTLFNDRPGGHAPKRPLVVGNPTVSADPDYEFPDLPGAEKEAAYVAGQYQTEPILREAATLGRIRKVLHEYDLLYFALHGIADERNGVDGSFLALSPEPNGNGRLTAREIQQMRLQAKLVVLSACQTGLGQLHDAGTIGLARAFTIAGAPRVVMSLWNVSDEATYHLMTRFVDALDRMQPAAALRRAMTETRKQYPNPSDWASFQLFGR